MESLTYFTPELAAEYGYPDTYDFLADIRPERISEFCVRKGLAEPIVVDYSAVTCACAPTKYQQFCEHNWPGIFPQKIWFHQYSLGQDLCTSCSNFCVILEGYQISKVVEEFSPATFEIIPSTSALWIDNGTYNADWFRLFKRKC